MNCGQPRQGLSGNFRAEDQFWLKSATDFTDFTDLGSGNSKAGSVFLVVNRGVVPNIAGLRPGTDAGQVSNSNELRRSRGRGSSETSLDLGRVWVIGRHKGAPQEGEPGSCIAPCRAP